MINFFKNIFSKFFSKTKEVVNEIKKKPGEEACTSCGTYVSAWMGGTDKEGNIIRTCIPCCDKENEGIEFKFENDNPEKQVIEYNGYKDGVKVGNTVRIGYFTAKQAEIIDKINEEIRKERKQ